MDLIKVSIQRPVTILSIIIMLVMFGMISLQRIPYQLSPSVVEPERFYRFGENIDGSLNCLGNKLFC